MSFWEKIEKPIIGLSPMDGVTDASFRCIVAKYGRPDIMFTEFVHVETVCCAPDTLMRDFKYSPGERPIIAQVYGRTPELFYKIAHVVCELGFDGIDINMGCPAKNIASKGSGAGLIRTPDLARSILRATRRGIIDWSEGQRLSDLGLAPRLIELVEAVTQPRQAAFPRRERRPIPVSVKTRTGYNRAIVGDWIRTLLEEHPAAISLHGRTLEQKYTGSADWDAIGRAAEIARGSQTLLLGNGDLRDFGDAYRRIRESGVDGVLFGRAALGNPWLFNRKHRLKDALRLPGPAALEHPAVSVRERFRVMLEHGRHFERHLMFRNFTAMRKHLAWYCRCFPGAAELRSRLVRVSSVEELSDCIARYEAAVGLADARPRRPEDPQDFAPPASASSSAVSCP